jgi:hypothetical protein
MNGYFKKRNDINQSFLDAGEQLGVQKMWDYMQLALRDPAVMGKDTFGTKRLEKLFKAMQELASEYHTAFTDDKEADYYQELLDRQLKYVWKDKFSPFYERYPQLKKIKYDKAKKGWK